MWNKIKNSKGAYMVLSIACAILLWLYVDVTVEPDTRVVIRNIPVSFIGKEQMMENSLMLTEGEDAAVTLTFKGPRSEVSQLKRGNVSITVDLAAQVYGEGEQQLGYNVTCPSSINTSNVKVDARSVDSIGVKIVKMSTRTVSVRGVFRGTVAEGYMYDQKRFTFDTEEITIVGEESIVKQVDHAEAVLSKSNLTDTWKGSLPLVLVDKSGGEVDAKGLTLSQKAVRAEFPVTSVKEVRLDVTIIEGGGATKKDISYSVAPKTIKVSGTREQLKKMDRFDIGTIDLSHVITSEKQSFVIELPDGMTNVSGTTTASVRLKIDETLSTTKLETSDIRFVNIPNGVGASCVTESMEVRLRGKADVMKLLVKDDVYIQVDLSDVQRGTVGTASFPAEIKVQGMSDIGAIGEYEVTVDLYPDEADESGEDNEG